MMLTQAEAQAQEDAKRVPSSISRQARTVDGTIAALAASRRGEVVTLPGNNPPQPAPPTPSEPIAPPAPPLAPPPPAPPPADNFEHKYNSLKGRYDQLEAQTRQQGESLASMQRLIATMNAAPAHPAPAAPPSISGLTPKEIEDYGQEMIDVMGRRAREVVSPEVAALKNKIDQLERQVGGVANVITQDARQQLFRTLDTSLPDWRVQNDDPKFISWLGLPDPYSGAIRHQLLGQAFAANDSSRVLRFFHGFIADEAATRPVDTTAPPAGSNAPAVTLESLAAPGRARQSGSSSNAPAEKRILTRAQVSQFYRDITAGAYAGRDAAKLAMENEIFQAMNDGRLK